MEKKMPLSLNQRNNRMIDSASQLRKPPPPPTPSTNAVKDEPKPSKLAGRRRLFKASSLADDRADEDPQFSDFDCPLEEESEKQVKVRVEGRRRLCKVSSEMKDDKGGALKKSDYDEPQFSVLSDFDSSASEKNRNTSNKKTFTGIKSGTDEPTFSILSDFDSPASEKIVSISSSKAFTGKQSGIDKPTFSILSDLDSPASEKIVSISNSKGFTGKQSGIDKPTFSILSDFDSPASEKIVSISNSKGFTGKQSGIDEPTFSILSDFESPAPEEKSLIRNENGGGGDEIRDILDELSSKLNFLSIDKTRNPKIVDVARDNVDEVDKIEVKRHEYNGNCLEYESATSSFSNTSDQSDSALEVTKQPGPVGAVEYIGDGDLPNESGVLNAKNIGKKEVSNEARKNTVKSCFGGKFIISSDVDDDLPSESEVNNVVNEVLSTKVFDRKQVSKEARKNALKSSFGGKSSAVDDDCVMLSRKIPSKNIERRGTKVVEVSDLTSEADDTDDCPDHSVGKEDGSITLSGPKYNFRLQTKIATMLYPHQRDGLKWLWSLHCQGKGGILGDDMGLGKTMQMCGYLAGLFDCGLIKRVLIVAPKTLIPHWIKELSAVGLSDMTRDYYGTNAMLRQYELQYILQDKGVLLTTYDIVRNNSKSLRGDNYFQDERSEDNLTWDYMILDEGHLIKNPSTQRAKSLLEIPSAHCIVISGTPIQNNLKELWALFNFCCPELLGDKSWFKEKYESPILRGNDKNASDRQKRIGSTVAQELRDRIQPYFLRRLKSEVFREDNGTNTAKLSKKSEMIVWLKLSSCQQQLYEAFLNSELVLSAFDGSPLAALTILKKICDHPLLLTKRAAEDLLDGMDPMLNPEDHGIAEKLAMHVADMTEIDSFQEKHDILSCKISFILSLLDNLIPQGHNVLIFSQTRKMLNLIQDSLITRGYKYLRIDGTTKASDRLKVVNEFQEGIGAPIFLLTSQVGGLGLTLTKADRVIVVDPAWNPSTDSQSVDRAYRIGQKKDVIVYRLMTCGTVEEKIYRKQIYKGGLFKSATEHKEQIRYFSQQDLRELFSLPKQGFGVSVTQQQLHEEHDSQHIMEKYLADHIKFLESQGIAGVSHHSLLFSKTAPVPEPLEEEEIVRMKQHSYVGKSSSKSTVEHNVDGAQYAFNPKDVKLHRNNTSTYSEDKLTEKDILERINRLSHILADKVTVSKLPDRGARIQNQITEITFELDKIRMAKRMAREVIDLDEITGSFGKVLNV